MNEIDYKFVHKDFRINGFPIDRNRLTILAVAYVKDGLPYRKSVGRFLLDWRPCLCKGYHFWFGEYS